MLNRRTFVAAASLLGAAGGAKADGFPNRPIRLVVPYAPGGGTDIAGRLTAIRLTSELGQSVVVENRGGAGGNIGSQAVAAAPKDGYSLLFAANSLTINAALYPNVGFNVMRDFAPVAGVCSTTVVLVVRSDLPVNSLAEFVT